MNELTLDGKVYVSSKRAAEITGYAKDYIGQMCREGRVEARLVGRSWYVLESSLRMHRFGDEIKADPVEKAQKPSITETWKSLSYESESVSLLPSIEKGSVNQFEEPIERHPPIAPVQNSLSELQDAWKDWFSRKESPSEEVETPSEAVEMAISDFDTDQNIIDEAEKTTESRIFSKKTSYEEDEAAVDVPIERIKRAPRPVFDVSTAPNMSIVRSKAASARASAEAPAYRPNKVLMYSLVVAAAALALVTVALNSGYVEKNMPTFASLPIVHTLAGVDHYQK